MLVQLFIGSLTILATMSVLVAFVSISITSLRRVQASALVKRFPRHRFLIIILGAVILILGANTLCVWIWAILFRTLGIFATMEEAVYFSMVSFTTVGYGDVVVEKGWRILSGFVAVNGLLAFGIFTAFLIELMRKISNRFAD